MRIVREVGSTLSESHAKLETQIRNIGALPDIDRTRGLLQGETSPQTAPGNPNAFIAYFTVNQHTRKIFLTLHFFPVPNHPIQGVFRRGGSGDLTLTPQLPRQTTPGMLLFAVVVASSGAVETGPNYPDLPDGWDIIYQDTYPLINGSVPRQSMMFINRIVNSGERTTTPITLGKGHSGTSAYAIWLWEIPDAGPARLITSSNTTVSDGETVELGRINDEYIFGAMILQVKRDSASLAPVVLAPELEQVVPAGSASSSAQGVEFGDPTPPQRALDNGVFAIGQSWWAANSNFDVDGVWWRQDWDAPISITKLILAPLLVTPFHASPQTRNAAALIEFSDGSTYDYPVQVNPAISYTLDVRKFDPVENFLVPREITSMIVTFQGDAPHGVASPTGWSEIVSLNATPNNQTVWLTNLANLSESYGTGYDSPTVYGAQLRTGGILEAYYENPFHNLDDNTIQYLSAAITFPNMRVPLPTIPYPENEIIIESGGFLVPSDLYASGVRVYLDGQDISQYVFGSPTGYVDIAHNRWEDIDISTWVKTPGQHILTITADDGTVDVDARFETN